MIFHRYLAFVLTLSVSGGCAVLHKTQLADISTAQGTPISYKVSQSTGNLQEAGEIIAAAGHMAKDQAVQNAGNSISGITLLFQYGPRTGTPVFTDTYATTAPEELRKKCLNGHLTNIISVRESTSYPVVKGEIVRIDATCVKL